MNAISPEPSLSVARKVVRDRNGNVVVPGGQLNVADRRRSVRSITIRFDAGERPRHHVEADQKRGEIVDAVRNQPQPADHVPLIRQEESGAARADSACVRD